MTQFTTQASPSYSVQSGSWGLLEMDAKRIRRAVFIEEQHIPEQDEWDVQDAVSLHFVLYTLTENDQAKAIATARLLSDHSIGRVAVLQAHRGKGIGRLLMKKVIEQAKKEQREYVKLSSQVHAVAFYESLGFVKEGQEYLDCGIPHIDMRLIF